MEAIEISAERRHKTGKGANRQLRASGRIPAVLYGEGVEAALSLSLCPRDLDKALKNPKKGNALFKVSLDDDNGHLVLVREMQRHPVSRAILHVDLVSPDLQKERLATIPIRIEGKAKGVALGGRLRTPNRDVRVSSLPHETPPDVVIDVTELDIGDAVMASDLSFSGAVRPVYDHDYVVANVVRPRGGGEEDDAVDEDVVAEAGEASSEPSED